MQVFNLYEDTIFTPNEIVRVFEDHKCNDLDHWIEFLTIYGNESNYSANDVFHFVGY